MTEENEKIKDNKPSKIVWAHISETIGSKIHLVEIRDFDKPVTGYTRCGIKLEVSDVVVTELGMSIDYCKKCEQLENKPEKTKWIVDYNKIAIFTDGSKKGKEMAKDFISVMNLEEKTKKENLKKEECAYNYNIGCDKCDNLKEGKCKLGYE